MSGSYRDEREAAMAANESLRAQNDELKGQLAAAEQQKAMMAAQHQQQLAMVQQGMVVPQPARSNTGRNVALFAIVGFMVVMCAAGMVAYLMLSVPAPPPPPPPVVYTPPVAPTGLRPNGQPWTQPVEAPPPAN